MKSLLTLALSMGMWLSGAEAGEVRVAVASNFAAPMQKLAQAFQQDTGHRAVLSIGSTGSFYAQIKHGAPFDVLLAADDETPLKLEREGLGLAGTRFTYAVGRLVLWSKQPGLVDEQAAVLRRGHYQRLAVANPKLAPYGAAAIQTLSAWGLLPAVQSKLVQGENIAQTFQFVSTGNAELGFVALSQVYVEGQWLPGSAWLVPQHLHAPIQQDAMGLAKGHGNPAAQALLAYLRSDKAKAIMRTFGYEP
jgi:molybdate transport system substrate-binding protein